MTGPLGNQIFKKTHRHHVQGVFHDEEGGAPDQGGGEQHGLGKQFHIHRTVLLKIAFPGDYSTEDGRLQILYWGDPPNFGLQFPKNRAKIEKMPIWKGSPL